MITLREEKGNPLTHQEMDNNFGYLVPISSIMAFPFQNIPDGWLECDGSELSRTAYVNLFNVIGVVYGEGDGVDTFNIPDLRGEFIRGWDHGRGVDNGREVGSNQGHLFASHRHSMHHIWSDGSGSSSGYMFHSNRKRQTRHTAYTGGTETRPRNIAMMFCIKY